MQSKLTTNFFMFAASMQTSLVDLVFMKMASLRGSSNLTLAATWNTIDTLSMMTRLSTAGKPRPSALTSPCTGINLSKASGRFSRSLSNSCEMSSCVRHLEWQTSTFSS